MSRERKVGIGMGRGDGERGSRGKKAMKVVWRREMEVEGWREKQVEKGEKWGWGEGEGWRKMEAEKEKGMKVV